ncbi:MmgE/PrpD family protein [Chloroflexota bacterium]
MKEKLDATVALAENIVNITYDDILREAVEVTKKDILDVIAVAIAAGSIAPGCREIVELAREEGGRKESTILGYGGKASSCMAAFANGAMTHSLDYGDTFDRGATHLGTGTVPAALAIAERAGKVTGKEFITAVTLGLDMGCRLTLAAQPSGIVSDRWVTPSVGGYFSGAAAAAKLLRLDRKQVINAFGHAYAQCAGPWENGYIESFNGELRGELLDREIFTTLEEAKILIEQWRREYNQVRPHSARNNRPPAPEAILTMATT